MLRLIATVVLALATIVALALLAGCGGGKGKLKGASIPAAAEEKVEVTADDVVPRAVLVSAELTTAVDEERYVAAAAPLTEFPPEQEKIFLVGKLKRLPTDSGVEVRWFRDADPEPMLVSKTRGSDTFSFVASLSPVGPAFISGPYTARIFVEDREVGGTPFTVTGTPPTEEGPRASELAVSTGVGFRMKPKRPGTEFEAGTKKLYATFRVDGAAEGSSAAVRWIRNGAVFHEEQLEVDGEGRFGAELGAPNGLPDGAYEVAVGVDGADEIKAVFKVGDAEGGARVDRLLLGHALGDDNLPAEAATEFSTTDEAIRCGLRFLDLPADSEISVQWLAVAEEGEPVVMYTVKSAVPGGGSGTMGAEWPQPDGGFEAGAYKAVVVVGGAALAEAEFTIQ
jgi:hypothetical protein